MFIFLIKLKNKNMKPTLFNVAYIKLGLKPISKCTIEELQEELNKRGLERNV